MRYFKLIKQIAQLQKEIANLEISLSSLQSINRQKKT